MALLVNGGRYDVGTAGFAAAIAKAYDTHARPRCLCMPGGVEMYVARSGDGYAVKRMPGSGSRHLPGCQSFEPPADASGIGSLLGRAIAEDVDTGQVTLRLGFSLSRRPGRKAQKTSASAPGSAAIAEPRLSLKSLLHYLWDQAKLTRWHPAFEGKRSWWTVRRHLLLAAEGKFTCSEALSSRLYVPEVFALEELAAADARRAAHWLLAMEQPNRQQQLLLLVAEAKRIEPARFGHRMVIKHLPDVAFWIEDSLFEALGRRFSQELSLWSASDSIRMVTAATFGISAVGVPKIAEMCLMPVTRDWLPIESLPDQQLVSQLVAGRRKFIKMLRYGLPPSARLASVSMTDCGNIPKLLFLDEGEATVAE